MSKYSRWKPAYQVYPILRCCVADSVSFAVKDCEVSMHAVRVVQTIEDGFCAYDSLIRGSRKAYEPESVVKEEMRILKSRMMEECVGWIINRVQGCDREQGVTNELQKLSATQSASLKLMGVPIISSRGESILEGIHRVNGRIDRYQ